MVSRIIGHYEVTEKLGEGGMGVVYKARDLRLGRFVAIKLLTPDIAANEERRKRFEQEARAASALNHPNIVTIYDIVALEGSECIVMEYIAGRDLRAVIGRRRLVTEQAVQYAVQIADALSRAHSAGIIHRDIKPENIMISDDGRVKVLDFGLAKLTDRYDGAALDVTKSIGERTAAGAIVGTLAYMSPEQLEGKQVDERTDIFSFGAVLYEMLTGSRAVVTDAPGSNRPREDPKRLHELVEVPAELERIISRCLRRDRSRRLQVMEDVKLELEQVLEELAQVPVVSTHRGPRRAKLLLALSCAAAIGVLLGLLVRPPGEQRLPSYIFEPLATEAGEESSPAWSPDGRTIAYSGEVNGIHQLFVKMLHAPSAAQITRMDSDCRWPFWSPDGSRVYYSTQGDLWSVSATGGGAQIVMKDARSGGFSPAGDELALVLGSLGNMSLWIASPPGTAPQRYQHSQFPGTFANAFPPRYTPDGSKIGIVIFREASGGARMPELWTVPRGAGTPHPTQLSLPTPAQGLEDIGWMPDSRHVVVSGVLFGNSTARLYMADTESGRIWPISAGIENESSPAVSPDGRHVAFVVGSDDFDVVEIPLDGAGTRRLVATSRDERSPTWSPSGNEYAYVTDARLRNEIWMRGQRGEWARPVLSSDSVPEMWVALDRPRFSPDGKKIAYDVYGSRHAIWISTTAGGRPVPVDSSSPDQHGPSWSPDGDWIAYRRLNAGQWELVKAPMAGGTRIVLAQTDGTGGGSGTDWSPSGDWICHVVESGIFLVSPDGRREKHLSQLSPAAFGFSADGSLLYAIHRDKERRWKLTAIEVPAGRHRDAVDLNLPLAAMLSGFSIDPTRKFFATSIGYARYDIWLMKGFGPLPSWQTLLAWRLWG